MATASTLPIDCTILAVRGAVGTANLTFTDEAGAAVNLTGDTITLTVRDAYGGTSKFTASGVITAPATGGLATVSWTAANVTDGKTKGTSNWVYVITRTHSGAIIPWFGGSFQVCETAM